jgi:hypothetical protein
MTADRAALRLVGFAEGDYMCRCTDCALQFQGDKRSILCRECAEKALAHTGDKRTHSLFANSENADHAALVEKVARAMCTDDGNPCGCVAACKIGKHYAVKAVDAIRTEVLEKAAYEAECVIAYGTSQAVMRENIAAAIRALKDKA